VLSPAGASRTLLRTAGQIGALTGPGDAASVPRDEVDEALGRLAGSSLLTFSVDGGTVTAHCLVMRVVRERLARQGRLGVTSLATAETLQAESQSREWETDVKEQPDPALRHQTNLVCMALHGVQNADAPPEPGAQRSRGHISSRMGA
jgi:hypothetical protein